MVVGKKYFGGIQDPYRPGKNPGVYGGDLIAIMTINGIWGMSMSHKGFFGYASS